MDSELAFETEANLEVQTKFRRTPVSSARGGARDDARKGASASMVDEVTPLLNDPTVPRPLPSLPARGDEDDWDGYQDFVGLPWYKKPNVFWLVLPFGIYAMAFGASVVPKLNIMIDLICRPYLRKGLIALQPTMPTDPTPPSDVSAVCRRSNEVASAVTFFTLATNLLSGILAAFTSPKLGELSDRRGRKIILAATSAGTLIGEIIFILAATYPETVSVYWIFVSAALDGLGGSFITALAISFAYTSDCHGPKERNVKLSYLYACFFTGIGLGPILSGYLVKWTGKLITMMYVALVLHMGYILIIVLLVPESLSKRRKDIAVQKHQLAMNGLESLPFWRKIRELNPLAPLKILFPTGKGSSKALRMNLVLIASIDTIIFGVAMGAATVIMIYTENKLEWDNFETSKYLSLVNCSRVVVLLGVLPVISKAFRKHMAPSPPGAAGSDTTDLLLIRIAVFFDTLAYLGFTLVRSTELFILSGIVSSIGGIGSPTLSSSLTKHVPSDRTGQLMGAMGLLHSLARVVAPLLLHSIYGLTIGKFDQAVFATLVGIFGLAFLLSLFLRPYVYYDEPEGGLEPN